MTDNKLQANEKPEQENSSDMIEELSPASPYNIETEGVKEELSTPEEEEYKPLSKHEEILYKVYKNENTYQILKILSYLCVALTMYAFVYKIVTVIPAAPMEALRLAVVCGIPFVAVSIARAVINAPRPYEIYSFYKEPPKKKKGRGFPSRHVFSVFVIASALAFENILLGAGLAALGLLLAVCRVLLGMHFVRDTVAGAVIGITSAVIGTYITRFIF